MKQEKTSRLTDGEPLTRSSVLEEVAVLPGLGEAINVRSAKAHLSALLNLVASGREMIITSDGKPKARMIPMEGARQRKSFGGSREHLKSMPKWKGGPTAEEIIRADRDERGW